MNKKISKALFKLAIAKANTDAEIKPLYKHLKKSYQATPASRSTIDKFTNIITKEKPNETNTN